MPVQCRSLLGDLDAQQIAESIPHLVWLAAPDGSTTYFNKRGTDYTGAPRETNYGWNWLTLIHPDDAEIARRGWEHATATGSEFSLEYRIRRHDGMYRWHAFRGLPVRDAFGEISMWIGTATDIEDRMMLELSLRRTEAEAVENLRLLEAVQDSTPVGIKVVDRDLRIVRMNRALAQLDGVSVEDVLNHRISETLPHLWPMVEPFYRRAFDGEVVAGVEVQVVRPADGGVSDRLASYYPVVIEGEVVAVGNIVIDVTEQKQSREAMGRNLAAMVNTIATTVEYRDPYTAGHQRRVAEMAGALATELGLDPNEVEGIRTAASIHDIGKISVPAEILSKPGKLSMPEMALIRQHADAGYSIVKGIDFPWPVAEMIRQHHERQDGSGYPRGLAGDEILLGSRIIAVADVIEAMVSHRPYRPGLSLEEALTFVADEAGSSLDEDAVGVCVSLLRSGRIRLQPWS